MKYYAGIDLHTRNTVVCVIDQKERKLVTETASNDLPSILSLLEQVPSQPSVAVQYGISGASFLSMSPIDIRHWKSSGSRVIGVQDMCNSEGRPPTQNIVDIKSSLIPIEVDAYGQRIIVS